MTSSGSMFLIAAVGGRIRGPSTSSTLHPSLFCAQSLPLSSPRSQRPLEEEMTGHLEAGYGELTPTRRGERNGPRTRNLLPPAGKIERLEVPRAIGVWSPFPSS
jgi:hypothetical protein